MLKFKWRRGTKSEWRLANPILQDGEPGVELGSNSFKIGDGQTKWNDLPYYHSEPGVRILIQSIVDGVGGSIGEAGKSAYELAIENGFVGTESEWLASLVGEDGVPGASAYELAVANGFVGTEAAWLSSLVGEDGILGGPGQSAYELAVANGFVGTEAEWLASLVGKPGQDGAPGEDFGRVRSAVNGTTAYIGRAPTGTDESASGWTVTRIVMAPAGTVTVTHATGSWTGREGLTYG